MLHSLITGRVADQALAWLLTYALHSTLLLGTAWGVSRRLGGRSLALQETIWRCALVGALVTASAQLALGQLGRAPIGGRWSLAAVAAPEGRPVTAGPELAAAAAPGGAAARTGEGLAAGAGTDAAGRAAGASVEGPVAGTSVARRAADAGTAGLAAGTRAAQAGAGGLGRAAGGMGPEGPVTAPNVGGRAAGSGSAWPGPRSAGPQGFFRHAAGSWPRLLLAVWLAGALALSLAYARSYLLLRRRLRYRPQVVGGGVLARLAKLVRASGISRKVRLTCTWRLSVPVALGTRDAEVCVPPRALFQLDDEQQDALLAHELAHLARRDPLWLPLTSLVPNFLFFQPLNWLARRRLRELSELLCDEWAVAHTGRPLSLAGCLAEVAGWSIGASGASGGGRKAGRLPVPGMAGRPSQLARRIRRLLDGPPLEVRAGWARPRREPVALPAVVAAVLAAVILAAPGVSAGPTATASAPAIAPTGPAITAGPRVAAVAPAIGTAPAATASSAPVAKDAAVLAAAAAVPAAEPVSSRLAAPSQAAAASAPYPQETAGGGAPVAAPEPLQDLRAESERLAEAAARLAQLDKIATLSKEQVAAINASVERISHEIEGKLGEHLDRLTHQLAAVHAHRAELPAAELAELDRELAGMTAELHPSKEELARMDAELRKLAEHPPLSREEIERIKKDVKRSLDQMPPAGLTKEEMEHLRIEVHRVTEESAAMAGRMALSPEEREKLVADAHRLAEQLRPSQAQLEALRALRHDQQELRRQLAQQHAEIESMRREIQRETEALREQARRLTERRRVTETPRVHPKPSPTPRPRAHPAPPAEGQPEPSPSGAQAPRPPAPPASAPPPAPAPPPAEGVPPPGCR